MPEFHDFADSFFSPAMWEPGAGYVPYVIAVLYAIVSISVITIVSRKWGEQPGFVVFLVFTFFAVMTSMVMPKEADREIAQKNIAVKYDSSNMTFNKFGSDLNGDLTGSGSNTITGAVYPDRSANVYRQIYFVFPEGSNEPFLLRKEMTDEEFHDLEKAILKEK